MSKDAWVSPGTVTIPLSLASEIYDLLMSDEGLALAHEAVIAKLVQRGTHYEMHFICTPPRQAKT